MWTKALQHTRKIHSSCSPPIHGLQDQRGKTNWSTYQVYPSLRTFSMWCSLCYRSWMLPELSKDFPFNGQTWSDLKYSVQVPYLCAGRGSLRQLQFCEKALQLQWNASSDAPFQESQIVLSMKQVIFPLETGWTKIEATAGLPLWAKQPLNTHTLHYSRANHIATKHPSSLGIRAYAKILYSDSSGCTVIAYFILSIFFLFERGRWIPACTTNVRVCIWCCKGFGRQSNEEKYCGLKCATISAGPILTSIHLDHCTIAGQHPRIICSTVMYTNCIFKQVNKWRISKLPNLYTNYIITRLAVQSKATVSMHWLKTNVQNHTLRPYYYVCFQHLKFFFHHFSLFLVGLFGDPWFWVVICEKWGPLHPLSARGSEFERDFLEP